MADVHMAYDAANGNARGAARLYQERFRNRYLPGHRMFANLHRRLREHGRFNENRKDLGRPRAINIVISSVCTYSYLGLGE